MSLLGAKTKRRLGTVAFVLVAAAALSLVLQLRWLRSSTAERNRIASYKPDDRQILVQPGLLIETTLEWGEWPREKGDAVIELHADPGTRLPNARVAQRHPLVLRISARDEATGQSSLEPEDGRAWQTFRGPIGGEIARVRPEGTTRLRLLAKTVPDWLSGVHATLRFNGARDDDLAEAGNHDGLVGFVLVILHGGLIVVFLVTGIALFASAEDPNAPQEEQRQ